MPFPNQHAARVLSPDSFKGASFRTITIKPGITAIIGKLPGETKTTVQAYRFSDEKFTPEQARAWLKDNSIKVKLFEKATGKEEGSANFADTDWFDIFQAGDRGAKGNYTTSDLKDMANAINNGEHVVPVIISHETDPPHKWDKPLPAELADGKLNIARVNGDIVQAKASVSERVKHFWDDNRLTAASVGVYKNLKNTGKKAIRHLAFLGKTPPGIKGLNYKPTFTFSEDEQNGEFHEIIFSQNNEEGDINMSREEELIKENEELKKKLGERDSAAFDELKKENESNVVDMAKFKKERDEEKTRADKAEADLKDAKEKAAFAEIEKDLQAEIDDPKGGLPKEFHDKFRALRAHELGLVDEKGVATFAEGKISDAKPTELMKELREAKRVPVESEGGKALTKQEIETFSEDLPAAQEKRLELTDARLEEMKKTNEHATFAEAATEIQKKHPELYPDMQ